MSQPAHVQIKPCVLEHYNLLCAAYEIAPTAAQVEEIRLVVGTHKSVHVDKYFEYALLYFLQRSAIVFEEDTLLLGWLHKPNGTRQEIWYKLGDTNVTNAAKNQSRLYLQRGGPPGSGHKARFPKPICDEWHPSLGAICTPSICDSRELRYVYLTSTIRLMRADPPPASIDDMLSSTSGRVVAGKPPSHRLATTRSLRPSLTHRRNVTGAQLQENTSVNQTEEFDGTEDEIANSSRSTRHRNRAGLENRRSTRSNHSEDLYMARERVVRPAIVDLTEVDSEEEIKSETHAASISDTQVQQPITQAEQQVQELRHKLRSKTVTEIKTTLAENSGQLPEWIEDVISQELGEKMLRDLGTIKNLF